MHRLTEGSYRSMQKKINKQQLAAKQTEFIAANSRDLKKQIFISLWVFCNILALLIGLYFQISTPLLSGIAILLIAALIFLRYHYSNFFQYRDRGQRTYCLLISMVISLIVTLGCVWYFIKKYVMDPEWGLLFVFGFIFFAFTLFNSLRTTMVKGNIIFRKKK